MFSNADRNSNKLKRLPAGNGGATRCSSALQIGWVFHICVSRPSSLAATGDRLTILYGSPARRRFRSSHMVVAEHEYGSLCWRAIRLTKQFLIPSKIICYSITASAEYSIAVHVSLACFLLAWKSRSILIRTFSVRSEDRCFATFVWAAGVGARKPRQGHVHFCIQTKLIHDESMSQVYECCL